MTRNQLTHCNDNEFISWKVLLDSVCFVMSYEDTYITYSCLKCVAIIMARFDKYYDNLNMTLEVSMAVKI